MNIAFSQNEVRKVRLMESGDLRIFRAVAEEGDYAGGPTPAVCSLQRHGPDPPAGGQAPDGPVYPKQSRDGTDPGRRAPA